MNLNNFGLRLVSYELKQLWTKVWTRNNWTRSNFFLCWCHVNAWTLLKWPVILTILFIYLCYFFRTANLAIADTTIKNLDFFRELLNKVEKYIFKRKQLDNDRIAAKDFKKVIDKRSIASLKAKGSRMYEETLQKHMKQLDDLRVLEKHIKNAAETIRLDHGISLSGKPVKAGVSR